MYRKKSVYSCQVFFELKKAPALGLRMGSARAFTAHDKLGLIDATGMLWPVQNNTNCKINSGDVVVFHAQWEQIATQNASKYLDNGFTFVLVDIVEKVQSTNIWPIHGVPNPIDVGKLLDDSLQQFTKYYNAPLYNRFININKRNIAVDRTRRFFTNRGFIWIETPTLVPSGGVERYVSAFHSTYIDVRGKSWPVSLPTSPEFALKKILLEGYDKVFQISHAYRNNGELSRYHEPEFLMLEWYRAGATLLDIMEDTKNLVHTLAATLASKITLPTIWPEFKVDDLFKQHCGFSLVNMQNIDAFIAAGKQISISINDSDDWDSVFCKLFMEKIEPFLLTQVACFVTDYPSQMAALARAEGIFAHRFEAYLQGIEICNGYFELVDTEELQKRFTVIEKQIPSEVRRDTIFEQGMQFGLPPCAGNAVGLDRVIAILLECDSISDLFAIPFLSQFPKNTIAPE